MLDQPITRDDVKFDHVWFWRKWLPDRKGQLCRVLARGKMNSVLIEFEKDGWKVITSRYAARLKNAPPTARREF